MSKTKICNEDFRFVHKDVCWLYAVVTNVFFLQIHNCGTKAAEGLSNTGRIRSSGSGLTQERAHVTFGERCYENAHVERVSV